MEKKEWKEMVAVRKAALERFECENVWAIHQSRELMYRHSRLVAAAREEAPPGYIRCAGTDDGIQCEEIIPREETETAGWQEQYYSCGDETDGFVCPCHASQRRIEGRCSWCAN